MKEKDERKCQKRPARNIGRRECWTEPIPKIITSMAVPSIIAFLINSIYSLADTYFVSGIGINATAAVSVNSSLDQIIMMAGSLLAVGANSYIARLLGAKKKKANEVLSTAFFCSGFRHRSDAFRLGVYETHGTDAGSHPPPVSSIPSTTPPIFCWLHHLWLPAS